MEITQVIAKNLTDWMTHSSTLNTLKSLSKASGVGFGTVRRAKNGDGNITVQNLASIARAFKRRPIDLLIDSTAPYKPTPIVEPLAVTERPSDEVELLQGYQAASPDVRELMLEAARRALEKKGEQKKIETQ